VSVAAKARRHLNFETGFFMAVATSIFENKSAAMSWVPNLLLLAVAMVWGTSYGVAKGAVMIYPVLGFLAIRFLVTFVLLLPVLRKAGLTGLGETLTIGFPLGVVLLAVFVCETFGLANTSAANAAFLISMCVVLTPFAEWIVLRVRPAAADIVATFLSLLGAYLLTSSVTLSFNVGDGLMLGAACLRAYMVTLTKKRTAGKQVDSLALTAIQAGTVGIGCILLALIATPGGLPSLPTDPRFWYATAYLVIFCTIFAFFIQNYAVRRISPTRVHLLMGTEPVFGALFAMFWLNEALSPMVWAGGLLIVAAPLWTTLRQR
jgi:drug/metabolite transporter (DMT)-like permease